MMSRDRIRTLSTVVSRLVCVILLVAVILIEQINGYFLKFGGDVNLFCFACGALVGFIIVNCLLLTVTLSRNCSSTTARFELVAGVVGAILLLSLGTVILINSSQWHSNYLHLRTRLIVQGALLLLAVVCQCIDVAMTSITLLASPE